MGKGSGRQAEGQSCWGGSPPRLPGWASQSVSSSRAGVGARTVPFTALSPEPGQCLAHSRPSVSIYELLCCYFR